MKTITKPDENTIQITPEVFFHTPYLNLKYKFFKKKSIKGEDIFILHHKLFGNLKFADLEPVYQATDEALEALHSIEKDDKDIKLYILLEITRKIRFIPDNNIYMRAKTYAELMRQNRNIHISGLVVTAENTDRLNKVTEQGMKFLTETYPGVVVGLFNNLDQAWERLNSL